MLAQKQEQQVQNLLDSLNELQVKARMLESGCEKGRELDESGNDIAQAIEELRSEQLSITEKLADEFQDNEMKQMANKLKAYRFDPANAAYYLKEIAKDIAELYIKALKLMLENMKRREKQEKAVEAAEKSNEQERMAQMQAKTKQYDMQKSENLLADFQKGLTVSPEKNSKGVLELLGLGDSPKSKLNNSLVPKKRDKNKSLQTVTSKSSKLLYVKSSDARAKDLANQRALKKHSLEMSKGAPAMAPAQMSR